MPGHKGRPYGSFLDGVLPYDVTELGQTDNLLCPSDRGPFSESFETAEKLFGTCHTIFSVSGATLALQAAIAAALRKSQSHLILCDRRAHLSVINAMALCGCDCVWFYSDDFETDNVAELCKTQRPAAVIVTSPDYYGRMADIAHIRQCIGKDTVLICDQSHGSHLNFYNGGKLHAYRQGADLVIDSIHKTLPSPTGTALLHSGDRFTRQDLLSAMRIFSSTSPSFLLASGICACLEYMKQNSQKIDRLLEMIHDFKNTLTQCGFAFSSYPCSDPFRICIEDGNAQPLYAYLCENGVTCEFADRNHLILIPSVMNTAEDFSFTAGLCRKFGALAPDNSCACLQKYLPEKKCGLRETIFAPFEEIDLFVSCGRTAAQSYAPYPPGIPVIMPGEIFDDTVIKILSQYGNASVAVLKQVS